MFNIEVTIKDEGGVFHKAVFHGKISGTTTIGNFFTSQIGKGTYTGQIKYGALINMSDTVNDLIGNAPKVNLIIFDSPSNARYHVTITPST